MLRGARGWVTLALCASACLSTPPVPSNGAIDASIDAVPGCSDGDGDGYLPAGCGDPIADDCNDADSDVFPGAFDDCTTPVDEDCVGGPLDCGDAIGHAEISVGSDRSWSNGAYEARFDLDKNFQLSSLTRPGGPELLVTSGTNERHAGVTYFNVAHSWSPNGASNAISALPDNGRAVVRFETEWQAHDQGAQVLDGTTLFTLYPDGRVHRSEHFMVNSIENTNTWLVAYTALNPNEFDAIEVPFDTVSPTDGTINPETGLFHRASADTDGYFCVYSQLRGNQLGWSWSVPSDVPAPSTFPEYGPRWTETNMGASVALQWDYFHNAQVLTGMYAGNFMIHLGPDQVPECTTVRAASDGFQNPVRLVNTTPSALVDLGDGEDADSDGYVEAGGFYALDADNLRRIVFEPSDVDGAVPPTMALRIANFDFSRQAVVTTSGRSQRLEHGRDYLVQPNNPGEPGGWLFLNIQLARSESVTVQAP